MRVLFAGGGTGGHLYPGLAIARALVRSAPGVEPYFVGAQRGIERDVLPTAGFPFALLDLHPLYRARPWNNWRTMRGALSGWRQLRSLAREEPIALAVGTGGYAAGLALAFARRRGIPYVLQEQNSYPGVTMRFFSRTAREIYLGFPEAAAALAVGRGTAIVDTGNPIDPPPATRLSPSAARAHWGFPPDARVLLIVGGSQGARGLNAVVAEWIAAGVPAGIHVIWATGKSSHDAYTHLRTERVRVESYLAPISQAYAASDVALTRSGAMTTAELCAWGIPMILVPLPTAAADHQTANARALQAAGCGIMIAQALLTVEILAGVVTRLLAHDDERPKLAEAAARRGRPDAAVNIARRITALLGASGGLE